MVRILWLALFFAMVIVGAGEGGAASSTNTTTSSLKSSELPKRNDEHIEGKSDKSYNDVVVKDKKKNNGGGGGVGWGWGGGGGGGNRNGGWGWGNGGGGGVFWRWGCNGGKHHRSGKTRVFPKGDYAMGEFAQCLVKGKCRGMRLDCPLHCGGLCVYDCRNMCKAHCKK
ncbi:eggshell protein 1-like [Salvia divinorum]|uniref:Eggshell protein 1-like n=1 Tax=Salvia divinorum TaxID=28513 RepID=A0ABD1FV16_SALDI